LHTSLIIQSTQQLILDNDDTTNNFKSTAQITAIAQKARRASCFDAQKIVPGYKKFWDRNARLPTLIYSSRANAGYPRISPKAGNMNSAIFRYSPYTNCHLR
jgi:hypothetical protein